MAIENLSITTAPFSGIVGDALPAGTVELIITHDEGIALQTSDFSIGGAQLVGNADESYLWNTVGANVTEGIIQVSFEPFGAGHVKAFVNHGAITIQEDQHNFYIDIDWNPQSTTGSQECCDLSQLPTANTQDLMLAGCDSATLSEVYGVDNVGGRTEEFLECYRSARPMVLLGGSKWKFSGSGYTPSQLPTPSNGSSHPPYLIQNYPANIWEAENMGYDMTAHIRFNVTEIDGVLGTPIDHYGYPGPCEVKDVYIPPGFPNISHVEIMGVPDFEGVEFGIGSTIPWDGVSEEVIDQLDDDGIGVRIVFESQVVFHEDMWDVPNTSQHPPGISTYLKVSNFETLGIGEEEIGNQPVVEFDWRTRSNASGMPQGGSNPVISGLNVSPKNLITGTGQDVTATISGSLGSEYKIIAYQEPEGGERLYYDVTRDVRDIGTKGRRTAVAGWSASNVPGFVNSKILSRSKRSYGISIPKNTADTDFYFYVEPIGNTILSKKCPSKENPRRLIYKSPTTVTISVLESVTGVTSTSTISSSTLTLRPEKRYKTVEEVRSKELRKGVVQLAENVSTIDIFLSHASAVVSSVHSFSLRDTFVNVYKTIDGVDYLIQRTGTTEEDKAEYENTLTEELGDFYLNMKAFDTTSATDNCTMKGDVIVRRLVGPNIKIEIDLNQIITTS